MDHAKGTKASGQTEIQEKGNRITIPPAVWEMIEAEYVMGHGVEYILQKYEEYGLRRSAFEARITRKKLVKKREDLSGYCGVIERMTQAEDISKRREAVKHKMEQYWVDIAADLFKDFKKEKRASSRNQIVRSLSIAQERVFDVMGIEKGIMPGDNQQPVMNVIINAARGTENW